MRYDGVEYRRERKAGAWSLGWPGVLALTRFRGLFLFKPQPLLSL